ncbi:hypothetical protein [Methylorubrum extorquens]
MADDFHDANDGRRYRARLRRQGRYQADYRSRLKGARAPQKADIAAACFEELLGMLGRNPSAATSFVNAALRRLSTRFDKRQIAERFATLVARAARDQANSARRDGECG